jgi:hypothetical protein
MVAVLNRKAAALGSRLGLTRFALLVKSLKQRDQIVAV